VARAGRVAETVLDALGFDRARAEECATASLVPWGRVARVDRGVATLLTADGDRRVDNSTALSLVVGDWVATGSHGAVRLTRRTELARRGGARKDERQPVVANVDLVIILHSAAAQFRLQLLSTFLVMAYDAGAEALVVLSKSDLINDPHSACAEATRRLGGIEAVALSTSSGDGIDALRARIAGMTIVLLGESGAGKSTLTNQLCGSAVLDIAEVSRGGQGKHTTTHRQLVIVPTGGVVIDTPGVRDAASFSGSAGIERAFHDVVAVLHRCRFADCSHGDSPGCAVRSALRDGTLDPDRLAAYQFEIDQRAAVERGLEARARGPAKPTRTKRQRAEERELDDDWDRP